MEKILEMYEAVEIKNKRMYIVVSSLVYLYLRHFDPLAMKLSDFKIISIELLQDLRKQLSDKGIIEFDYEKEVDSLVSNYLEKLGFLKHKEECMSVYKMIKKHGHIRGYTSRVVSASTVLFVLNKNNEKFKVADLFKFYHSTDVSVYSFKKIIETLMNKEADVKKESPVQPVNVPEPVREGNEATKNT